MDATDTAMCDMCNGIHPMAKLLPSNPGPDVSPLCRACSELTIYDYALRMIIDNDLTQYRHHQPRRDGKTPNQNDPPGSCWLTPREIALDALERGRELFK